MCGVQSEAFLICAFCFGSGAATVGLRQLRSSYNGGRDEGISQHSSRITILDDVSLPVQKQLEAYNARDIDAFMPWWADDCQYCSFPNTLLAGSAADIKARHEERFKEPDLHGKLLARIVVGNVVIDHETVTRTFP